ncbi:MAG: aspartate kinase, partial [Salinibacterium sp.]|nr:aspartate kinase [Salinibacterium sp.]
AAARAAESGDQSVSRRLQKGLVSKHHACAEALFEDHVPDELARGLRQLFDELRVLLQGVYLLRELSPRSMDAIASIGERLSTRIFASYLSRRDVQTEWLDARLLMRTDRRFGAARPLTEALQSIARERLLPRLAPIRAVVTQGYIGATEDGLTTTLGRGGSDYSAALFGAAIEAEEVQVWTDVEGILTCDPRVVPQARPIPEISFAEAAELAAFGAKVLHPATIQPAVAANIPVTVRHTGKPEGRFTTIKSNVPARKSVTALASRGPVSVLTVSSTRMLAQSGFLARLFEVFGRLEVSVDLVATAEVSVSLTVEPDAPLVELQAEIGKFADVSVAENRAIVAVVGDRLRHRQGLTRQIFEALQDLTIEMISMGASETNLSLVVASRDTERALQSLHRALIEESLT